MGSVCYLLDIFFNISLCSIPATIEVDLRFFVAAAALKYSVFKYRIAHVQPAVPDYFRHTPLQDFTITYNLVFARKFWTDQLYTLFSIQPPLTGVSHHDGSEEN